MLWCVVVFCLLLFVPMRFCFLCESCMRFAVAGNAVVCSHVCYIVPDVYVLFVLGCCVLVIVFRLVMFVCYVLCCAVVLLLVVCVFVSFCLLLLVVVVSIGVVLCCW